MTSHGPASGHAEGCFGCRVKTVNLAPSARGSYEATEAKRIGKGWERDLPAYRALRADGLQPKHVDGAADLQATATTAHQIEGRPDPAVAERVAGLTA